MDHRAQHVEAHPLLGYTAASALLTPWAGERVSCASHPGGNPDSTRFKLHLTENGEKGPQAKKLQRASGRGKAAAVGLTGPDLGSTPESELQQLPAPPCPLL